MLITTALVPVVGRLADMFGRKNLYNAGFAIFTLGSFLCTLSQPQFHGRDLVLYRIVQGVGGAMLRADAQHSHSFSFGAQPHTFGYHVPCLPLWWGHEQHAPGPIGF